MQIAPGMSETPGRLQHAYLWYLAPRLENQSAVGWWESRRFAYNLVLFLLAIAIFVLLAAVMGLIKHRLLSSFFGLGYLLAIVQLVIQICANFWYTGGWIIELLAQLIMKRHLSLFGPRALLAGTAFSILFEGALLIYFGIAMSESMRI
jgi:hypothetical protein